MHGSSVNEVPGLDTLGILSLQLRSSASLNVVRIGTEFLLHIVKQEAGIRNMYLRPLMFT